MVRHVGIGGKDEDFLQFMIYLAAVIILVLLIFRPATPTVTVCKGTIFVAKLDYEEIDGVNFTKVWSFSDPQPEGFLEGWFYTCENVTQGSLHDVVVVKDFIVSMD